MKMSVAPDHVPDRSVLVRRAFEEPQRGRADGDDPPASLAHLVERRGRFLAERAALRMHRMLVRIVRLDRQERAGADMQRHEVLFDSRLVQPASIRPGVK